MKRNKLKNLAVVLACTMMLGTMPSSIDAGQPACYYSNGGSGGKESDFKSIQ